MTLYTVATPIGNLDDFSARARTCLAEVDLVAAEDTRRAKHLFSQCEIPVPTLMSCFDHNEKQRVEEIIKLLQQGKKVALISDAGTPCVNDPGYQLVRAAHQAGIQVVPIPGCSAVTCLIQASGLASDRFTYVGFLPKAEQAKRKEVKSWLTYPGSLIFFETALRFPATLQVIRELLPKAMLSVGRELTKHYEDIITGSVDDVSQWVTSKDALKGEIVCMLDLSAERNQAWSAEKVQDYVKQMLAKGAKTKEIVDDLYASGWSKDELYKTVLACKATH